MPKIKINQIDKELEAKPGENILEVLQREGIDINAYCGGFGYCGKCIIQILKGDAVSYTHLRAHETVLDLVCRLLLEKKNKKNCTQI